ncbi:hypothetical protein ACOMHN_039722 [Nucella lapillus]
MRPVFLVPLLCLSLVIVETQSKRVLIIPMPFTSHTKYHSNVARALSKLGHKVWVTVPDYLTAKNVLDLGNLNVLEYQTGGHVESEVMEGLRGNYFRGERDDWSLYLDVLKAYTDELLTNDTFFREIRRLQPEFVIIDNIPNIRVVAIIPYRLGIPFAFLGCAYDPVNLRVPFTLAVNPVPLFPFTDHMTLGEKLQNSIVHVITALMELTTYPDAVSRYAPEMPYMPLDMLVAQADIWLVETDHILDYPRSTMPNVKLIGGTATGPAQPLADPFRAFMDGATQGVVIVSFGSYVLEIPKDVSDKIFSVLMELPLKAVFRSNLVSPDPDKILTAAWIPQNDLLGHRNTRVFVSHSGNNGQYEALFHAVPIVAAPIFSDQGYNAQRIRTKGFGEIVDIKTVSAEELKDAILKVAFTERYKQSISKASELFKIEFGVPMEKAAFWLDHVMKYGADHMRSAGQDMHYYQFLGIDVILCYFVFISVVFALLFLCLYTCLRCVFGREKKKID